MGLWSTEPVVAAVIGVAGAMIGAALHYVFTARSARLSRQSDQIVRAYGDYLAGAAAVVMASRSGDKAKLFEAYKGLCDAKCRIAVFGDSNVLEQMARFEKLGGQISSSEQRNAFCDVVRAMRKGGYAAGARLDNGILASVILGEHVDQA